MWQSILFVRAQRRQVCLLMLALAILTTRFVPVSSLAI